MLFRNEYVTFATPSTQVVYICDLGVEVPSLVTVGILLRTWVAAKYAYPQTVFGNPASNNIAAVISDRVRNVRSTIPFLVDVYTFSEWVA
jgi:hypothetical protein